MDALTVARVRRAHGLTGEILVHAETDDGAEIFTTDRHLAVRSTGRLPAPLDGVTVLESRPHRGGFLLKLREVGDRRSAEALRGAELLLERDELRPLEEDEYFLHELVGLEVVDEERGSLGPIVDVYDAAAQVLAALRIDGREHLFPVRRETVRKVDMEAGRIEVRLPSGLLDL